MSYQPRTGERCSCRPGVARDNCPDCEGTGWRIDFRAIRRRAERAAVHREFNRGLAEVFAATAPRGTRVRVVASGVTGRLADEPSADTALRFVLFDREHQLLKLEGFDEGLVFFPRELEVLS